MTLHILKYAQFISSLHSAEISTPYYFPEQSHCVIYIQQQTHRFQHKHCTFDSDMNDNGSLAMQRTTDLNLFVWLEPHQAADLMSTGVKDAGTNEVLRVRIDAVQYPSPKAHQLHTHHSAVTTTIYRSHGQDETLSPGGPVKVRHSHLDDTSR